LIADGQLERGIDVALLLVASDVDVQLSGTLVGQTMDEPWVGVEVEDDGFVICEDGFPFAIRQAVRVVDFGNQLEEVDDVDETDLEVGEEVAE